MVRTAPVHRGVDSGRRRGRLEAADRATRSVGGRVKGEDDLAGIRDGAIHDGAGRSRRGPGTSRRFVPVPIAVTVSPTEVDDIDAPMLGTVVFSAGLR